MDIQDRKKSLTVEELRQRYNLEDISKNKKAIQVQKDSITKLDAHLEDFIDATTESLEELQDQVDGNITTWFYSGVPTLSNEPAVEWTTDEEKNRHFGDLYYDQSTGYAYRFGKQSNQYVWIKLTDSDVTEALRIANEAQDTADNKRRVFTTTPTTPYDVGDLYLYNEDLYVCSTARESGSYVTTDFEIATKYTDDTALNNFVNVTYAAAMQNLTNQIDGKISTWYYNGVPTLSNLPASAWTTDEEKQKHTGDLYYDRETGYCYMFEYESSTYKWTRIEDSSITEALAVANAAQDTADNKRRVFVVQPTPPYDIGDIWIKEDKDLYRCKTATQEGGTFNMSHWILATNYTDDTVALEAKQELDQFKVDVQETYATNADLVTTANSINGTVNETYTYITTVESNLNNQISDITTTTKTSTGKNSLYLEDAMESNALGYSVDGATEQQTYTGKNLCGIPNQTFTHNGVTVTIQDGEITLNGTANATGTKWIDPIKTTTINGNYVNNCIYISGTTPSTNPANFNVRKSDGTIIQGTQVNLVDGSRNAKFSVSEDTSIIFGIYVQNSTTYTNYKFKPQLVSGTTTDYNYEPYVGGTSSPNPDYPQKVKTVPSIINKLNYSYDDVIYLIRSTKSQEENGFKITSTGESGYGFAGIRIDNSLLGKTVTISMKSTGNKTPSARIYYESTNNTLSSAVVSFWTTNNSLTTTLPSTLPSGQKGLVLVLYISQGNNSSGDYATFTDIQIEEGTTAHEYVPYGYWSKVKVTGKNIFNNINYITTDAAGCTLSSLNTGIRATLTATGYYRRMGVLIPDVKTLLGKTLTLSAEMTPSSSNNGRIAIYEIVNNTAYENGVIKKSLQSSGSLTFTMPDELSTNSQGIALLFYGNNDSNNSAAGDYVDYTNVMLEENEESTTYEPYKENQVLIDMSKPNMITTLSANWSSTSNGNINQSAGTQYFSPQEKIEVKPSTTYSIIFDGYVLNQTDPTVLNFSEYNDSGTFIRRNTSLRTPTFTTGSTTKYIFPYLFNTNGIFTTTGTKIYLFESNNVTPYHELCKIGDYKDTLSIDSSGNCVINKNIEKVVLNGGEVWSNWSSQTFTNTILCGTSRIDNIPRIGYVQMSNYFTGQSSTMWATDVEGVTVSDTGSTVLRFRINKTIASDLNTFKTWLSTHNTEVYYVLATPETITLPNTKIPLFEGINHVTFVDDLDTSTSITYYRNTPLSGTYATQTQLSEVSTQKTQEIIQVRNEVQTEITATNASINVINETIENGVSKVSGTGYTFDSEGLKIEKTGQDVKTLIDNDGLVTSYKNTEILTVRSNGIEAENMTVRKFYVQRPIRMEKTKSISDGSSVGLGFFYVGE